MGGRGASSGVKGKKTAGSVDRAKGTSSNATLEMSDTVIRGAGEESLKRLAELAKSGELPSKIEGNSEERARIYEEIDRLYPAPPGVMSQYNVYDYGGSLVVDMNYGLIAGENPPNVKLPRYSKASESERSGAIKYAIYKHRGPMEMAATCRADGYPTYDMANKWGGRILSSAEKVQVDHEIEAHVQNLFRSPMSRAGRKLNASNWVQQGGGWRRFEDPAFTRDLVDRARNEARKK